MIVLMYQSLTEANQNELFVSGNIKRGLVGRKKILFLENNCVWFNLSNEQFPI